MKSVGVVPWLLFLLWCSWLYGIQGLFASSEAWGHWVPDLGLVLLLAYDARPSRSSRPSHASARLAAGLVACARIAFSADPPLAILAGYLGVAWAFVALRDLVELERALPRMILAGLAALLLTSFWTACRSLSLANAGQHAPAFEWAWESAVSTAMTALLLLPLFARLPGLRPLTVGALGPMGRMRTIA